MASEGEDEGVGAGVVVVLRSITKMLSFRLDELVEVVADLCSCQRCSG